MSYDYSRIIDWIEMMINGSKSNVLHFSEQLNSRLQENDFYIADITELLVFHHGIIDYLSYVQILLNNGVEMSPIQVASNVMSFVNTNETLNKSLPSFVSVQLMNMLAKVEEKS